MYYIYDQNRRLLRLEWQDKDGRRPTVKHFYNEKGQLVEKKYYRKRTTPTKYLVESRWASTERYTYYHNGLLAEYKKYNGDKLVEHTKRFYE